MSDTHRRWARAGWPMRELRAWHGDHGRDDSHLAADALTGRPVRLNHARFGELGLSPGLGVFG